MLFRLPRSCKTRYQYLDSPERRKADRDSALQNNMPRHKRIVIPDVPHHVTQRGNNQNTVFDSDADFDRYLKWLSKYAQKYLTDILAYCLMPNHVHFVITPKETDSLARLFNTLHMRYSQYKNYKSKKTGHLWQGRFFSSPLGDEHLYNAIRYVERNPVRANLADYAWNYRWSSAAFHCGKTNHSWITKTDTIFKYSPDEWKEYLSSEDETIVDKIRAITIKGGDSALFRALSP